MADHSCSALHAACDQILTSLGEGPSCMIRSSAIPWLVSRVPGCDLGLQLLHRE